jgi:hypothetical protein
MAARPSCEKRQHPSSACSDLFPRTKFIRQRFSEISMVLSSNLSLYRVGGQWNENLQHDEGNKDDSHPLLPVFLPGRRRNSTTFRTTPRHCGIRRFASAAPPSSAMKSRRLMRSKCIDAPCAEIAGARYRIGRDQSADRSAIPAALAGAHFAEAFLRFSRTDGEFGYQSPSGRNFPAHSDQANAAFACDGAHRADQIARTARGCAVAYADGGNGMVAKPTT